MPWEHLQSTQKEGRVESNADMGPYGGNKGVKLHTFQGHSLLMVLMSDCL